MSKSRSIILMLCGVLIAAAGVYLFVHDAEYIFTGNTVDLNEAFEENADIESLRDKYVTYVCYFPLDNYAETQEYLDGFILLQQEDPHLYRWGMNCVSEVDKLKKIC